MKEQIIEWLSNNNITDYMHLRKNTQFINFLNETFPGKTEEQISTQVLRCAVGVRNDIDAFCGCLATGLSN